MVEPIKVITTLWFFVLMVLLTDVDIMPTDNWAIQIKQTKTDLVQ